MPKAFREGVIPLRAKPTRHPESLPSGLTGGCERRALASKDAYATPLIPDRAGRSDTAAFLPCGTRGRGDHAKHGGGGVPFNTHAIVMAGPVPAIHVFLGKDDVRVDARHKAGHDVVCRLPEQVKAQPPP